MIAYIDSVGGAAGDMLLAALLDAGASEEALRAVPDRLGLTGVELEITRVERQGVGALHVDVIDTDPDSRDGIFTTLRMVRHQLTAADLNDEVRASALSVFARLGTTEARVHGVDPGDVHFHELGAVDTLVDIVGVVTLLADLEVTRLVCSPLPLGRGFVTTAHGVLPLPAPATAALLEGVPVFGIDIELETVTPTGAALLSTLVEAWGPMPALTLGRIGCGAGTADPAERANIVRVMLGRQSGAGEPGGEVALLETNLDDLLPELIPDAMAACFDAGALDTWTAPVTMKKGRPGLVFSALARRGAEATVAEAMLVHTSALGVRVSSLRRYELERRELTVDVRGHAIRVKLGELDGRVVNVAPEHDDCAAVAAAVGASAKSIWAQALAAARELQS